MKTKKILLKLAQFAQTLEILNDILKTTLVQKCSRIKVHSAWLYSLFYPKAKFGHTNKRIKIIDIIPDGFLVGKRDTQFKKRGGGIMTLWKS
jgi:hypothetical protein